MWARKREKAPVEEKGVAAEESKRKKLGFDFYYVIPEPYLFLTAFHHLKVLFVVKLNEGSQVGNSSDATAENPTRRRRRATSFIELTIIRKEKVCRWTSKNCDLLVRLEAEKEIINVVSLSDDNVHLFL